MLDLVAGRIEFLDAPKRYLHRDGRTLWAQANVAVMRDAEGTPLLLLHADTDFRATIASAEASTPEWV